jgi:hypothetical protein
MSALAAADRHKLAQLVALAASSEYDNEAVTALRAAVRLAANVGLTLVDALRATAVAEIDLKRAAALEQDAYARGYRKGCEDGAAPAVPASWPQFADRCLTNHPRLLNDFERRFCASVIERGMITPSPKQMAVLQRLSAKCGVASS